MLENISNLEPDKSSQVVPEGLERLWTGALVKFQLASKERLPTTVIVHGWKSSPFKERGSYEQIAEILRTENQHTLILAMRGSKFTEGDIDTVTRADHEKDILAAFEYLESRPEVDMDNVSAFGTSYGGYLLASMSDRLNIKKLALRVPALYSDVGWDEPSINITERDENLASWRAQIHDKEESAALRGISNFEGDILIVSSEFDEDMPKSIEEGYVEAGTKASIVTHEVMLGATHALNQDSRKIFNDLYINWIKSIQ